MERPFPPGWQSVQVSMTMLKEINKSLCLQETRCGTVQYQHVFIASEKERNNSIIWLMITHSEYSTDSGVFKPANSESLTNSSAININCRDHSSNNSEIWYRDAPYNLAHKILHTCYYCNNMFSQTYVYQYSEGIFIYMLIKLTLLWIFNYFLGLLCL